MVSAWFAFAGPQTSLFVDVSGEWPSNILRQRLFNKSPFDRSKQFEISCVASPEQLPTTLPICAIYLRGMSERCSDVSDDMRLLGCCCVCPLLHLATRNPRECNGNHQSATTCTQWHSERVDQGLYFGGSLTTAWKVPHPVPFGANLHLCFPPIVWNNFDRKCEDPWKKPS